MVIPDRKQISFLVCDTALAHSRLKCNIAPAAATELNCIFDDPGPPIRHLLQVKYDAYEGGYQGSPLTSHDREELIAIYLREDI